MEATYEVGVSLAVAAAVVSLFAILRLAFRSPSTPSWATDLIPAYLVALLLTFAVAGSLFYLAIALSGVAPAWVAFFGTFAIHIGLVAVFLKLLPISEDAPAQAVRQRAAPSQGVAA